MSDTENLAELIAIMGANTAKFVISMLPVLCVYPFVQKYLNKGIVHESVKG